MNLDEVGELYEGEEERPAPALSWRVLCFWGCKPSRTTARDCVA
jgi:hypothetical protein